MRTHTASFNLEQFLNVQGPVLERARDELRAGRKASHWMWFVFPQIAGLGHSTLARHYAITTRGEAEAYLAHPALGPRLREMTAIVNQLRDKTAHEIFGAPDDLKFRSSMTLFAAVAGPNSEFRQALDTFFAGRGDPATLERLD